MTNAQWSNVITKLTTALNAAAVSEPSTSDALFKGLVGVIELEKTQEYNYYKIAAPQFLLNSDYVIGAIQTDLSEKVLLAVKAAGGNGPAQQ